MVKNPKHGNRQKEKGITLLETIIALGIIVIVSLAAVTINVSASSAMNNNRIKSFFVREMNTIAKLYSTYWTETENAHKNFRDAIEDYTGRTLTVTDGQVDNAEFYYSNTFETSSSSEKSFYLVLDFKTESNVLKMTSYRADDSELFKKEVRA